MPTNKGKPELPEFVSLRELSWLLGGITAGRVSQLESEGLVERVGRDRYTLSSVPNFIKAMRARAEGPSAYNAARTAWMQERARRAEMDRRVAEGKLAPTDQIQSVLTAILLPFRSRILA